VELGGDPNTSFHSPVACNIREQVETELGEKDGLVGFGFIARDMRTQNVDGLTRHRGALRGRGYRASFAAEAGQPTTQVVACQKQNRGHTGQLQPYVRQPTTYPQLSPSERTTLASALRQINQSGLGTVLLGPRLVVEKDEVALLRPGAQRICALHCRSFRRRRSHP